MKANLLSHPFGVTFHTFQFLSPMKSLYNFTVVHELGIHQHLPHYVINGSFCREHNSKLWPHLQP